MGRKIQSIEFKAHSIFKDNSKLTFFDKNIEDTKIPKIFFLVGDNGSGKTSILKNIYNAFEVSREHEKKTHSRSEVYFNKEIFEKYFSYSTVKINIFFNKEIIPIEIMVDPDPEELRLTVYPDNIWIPILYDKVNTNFKNKKITNFKPIKEYYDYEDISYEEINLAEEIPNLLIKMRYNDNECYVNHHNDNDFDKTKCSKLNKFLNAFSIFYKEDKKFEKIEITEDKIEILFKDTKTEELVDISTFSTGEKQIIYRVGNLIKNINTMEVEGGIILIDEPETSLHPTWQKKYVEFLMEVFKDIDVQFIIATHSPYILQGMKENESVAIKIDRKKNNEIGEKIGYYKNGIKNPSINLINYLAYGIVDELLHIELFTTLEIKHGGYKNLERNILKFRKGFDNKKFMATLKVKDKHEVGDIIKESLPIYIRNAIHHADETARKYTENDLEKSIKIMLNLL